ncbi:MULTISPECIES: hypothetical protein [Paenibacillus]|jgi:hypothetical protein|nr:MULTISPECIES: hypothetical protein [Paenibacillus]KAF6626271.1 hypothetical protein HFE01_22685 [Paenibacillus sp. EKM10P]KAF6642728.1 hypothetical protein HFE02_22600 [Paenibacillus sp. EKM11P]KAF6614886.1 hypothetical protein HFE00_22745 [Paenibacillus sp. EKM101P]KAF6618081.1 hypothetical protein HFE03_22605 [Paenibacillus sp. EKM102P]KJD39726.1 hypothetical protein QD46_12200 [Paenibacillus polymyxa]
MLFITKKLIDKLAEPYRESDMLICYSTPQSFSAYTSRAILLLNNDRIIMLFLNLFSTKVVQKVEFEVADLQEQKYYSGLLSSVIWSFNINGQHWRFSIMRKILPLGSMQRDFLNFLQQNILN